VVTVVVPVRAVVLACVVVVVVLVHGAAPRLAASARYTP
jgi:hypothetical protein